MRNSYDHMTMKISGLTIAQQWKMGPQIHKILIVLVIGQVAKHNMLVKRSPSINKSEVGII